MNNWYIKQLTFVVVSIVLVVFVLPEVLSRSLGMFAIGWCLTDIAERLFPKGR